MAAMRHCLTDPSNVRERLDDIRRVVEHIDEFPNDLVIPVVEHDLTAGYDAWAEHYDGPNPAVEADAVVVRDLLEAVPPGVALDAGCGTGRHSRHLADGGFEVIGVDDSRTMLARGEAKCRARLSPGDLGALPADDAASTCGVLLASPTCPSWDRFGRVRAPSAGAR
jgi:SAM-dependent methyltransferase